MATPDPDMEEMRIMSYESRERTCKRSNEVQRRNDYIEVMWCLDHLPGLPERWCTAQVIHVAHNLAQDAIASGVMRYLPDDKWDGEIHLVDFLNQYKLRRSRDKFDEEDQNNANGESNTITPWNYRRSSDESLEQSDDDEWDVTTQSRRKGKGGGADNQIEQKYEIQSLRSNYATLRVEIDKPKRQLTKQAKRMSQIGNPQLGKSLCSSAGVVLARLKHRIGLKMQNALRTMLTCTGKRKKDDLENDLDVRTGDGIHIAAMRVRVECNLDQFEAIAAFIKGSTKLHHILFEPDFCHTQLPSPCSAAFSFKFTIATMLLSYIGVTSFSDILEMMRKCGAGPQGDILRVPGTYEFDKDNENRPAIIHIGTSSGHRDYICINKEQDDAPTETRYASLTRKSRVWNKVDQRFVHPLNLRRTNAPALELSNSNVHTFSLNWKKDAELGPRTWSKDMRHSAQVFGWLEANLSYLPVEGKHLCEETGGILPDDIWQDMFGSKILGEKSSYSCRTELYLSPDCIPSNKKLLSFHQM